MQIMSEPIRVLHVFGVLNKGGAESRTMDIYRWIDRGKVQFDFMVHTKKRGFFEPEIESLGGRVYREMPQFRNVIKYVKCWNLFLAGHKYDYIHIHMLNVAVPVLFAAIKNNVRIRICHARSAGGASLSRRLFTRITRLWVRKWSTHRFAVSDMAGKFAFGGGYKIIKNAINANPFRYCQTKRKQIRKNLKVEDAFVIGQIGSFQGVKNHLFTLDVFAVILEHEPHAKLIFAGDGKLRPQIEQKITKLGIEDKVVLLGVRDDIPDLLQAFDVFIMPSLYEGLPGAALEAQAAGLPCLLSNTITPEARAVKNLADYLPIDKGAEPWVQAIAKLAGNRHPRRDAFEEIKAAGFDIEDVAKWYEEFYTDGLLLRKVN